MSSDILYVTEAVHDEIVTHARQGKPHEVCGILRGVNARVRQLVRGRNIAPDPCMDYEIDHQTLLRQFEFEEEGDEMVAIYHSHPVSPAYPSASDAWNAHYPDSAYLICSLEDDDAPSVRAFRLIGHEVSFDLDELRTRLDFDETRPGCFAHYQAAGTPVPSALHAFAHIPAPYYIVYEFSTEGGEDPYCRVVSVSEYEIQTTSG